jgi:hypothetical protein
MNDLFSPPASRDALTGKPYFENWQATTGIAEHPQISTISYG